MMQISMSNCKPCSASISRGGMEWTWESLLFQLLPHNRSMQNQWKEPGICFCSKRSGSSLWHAISYFLFQLQFLVKALPLPPPVSWIFWRRTTVFLSRVRSSQRASCIRSVVEPTRKVLATAKLRLRLEDAYPCLVCFVVYFGFAKDNYWGCFCQILRKERQHPYFWNRISYEKEAQLSDSVLRKER